MKKWLLAVGMMVWMALLAGCASGPKKIEIETKNMAFSTKQITLKAGVPVRLFLVNNDTVVHDFSVDTIPVDVTAQTANPDPAEHTHAGEKEPDLHVAVLAGEKGWVEFTPMAAGTYTFYCSVSGHMAGGMQGTLVVK